ncbi:MAG: hypothetical protein Q9162_002769 [Coniocarpon cinnabarinum]
MSLPDDVGVSVGAEYDHQAAVNSISARLQHFYACQKPYRVYHGSTNSTRLSHKTADSIVDTSHLNNVLGIRHAVSVPGEIPSILVEPNVTMSALVDSALPYGLLPPVVMEFPNITAGGGFTGTSGESSSFREGFFDRNVTWIEMVLPNGEVVTATPNADDPRRDLFEGAASSFGTLGIVTALRIRLRPAKAYVLSRYVPVGSVAEAKDIFVNHRDDPNVDFMDGIMYSVDRGVIILGRLASQSEVPSGMPVQRFTRPWDQWYYLHVESRVYPRSSIPFLSSWSSSSAPVEIEEAVPIRDYLFRYDRGGFWVAEFGFQYFGVPFNRFTRALANDWMNTKTMFHALHMSGLSNSNIVQDVAVPFKNANQMMQWLDGNFHHYPLWLCPLKMTGPPPLFHRGQLQSAEKGDEVPMHLNFGVWGPGSTDWRKFVEFNRAIEAHVQRLGGQKTLYAQVYYTEDEFWNIYGKERYDALRRKYAAAWLPSVFDKMKVDLSVLDESEEDIKRDEKIMQWGDWINYKFWKAWPMAGLYGVAHCIVKKEYVVAEDPFWKRWASILAPQSHAKIA